MESMLPTDWVDAALGIGEAQLAELLKRHEHHAEHQAASAPDDLEMDLAASFAQDEAFLAVQTSGPTAAAPAASSASSGGADVSQPASPLSPLSPPSPQSSRQAAQAQTSPDAPPPVAAGKEGAMLLSAGDRPRGSLRRAASASEVTALRVRKLARARGSPGNLGGLMAGAWPGMPAALTCACLVSGCAACSGGCWQLPQQPVEPGAPVFMMVPWQVAMSLMATAPGSCTAMVPSVCSTAMVPSACASLMATQAGVPAGGRRLVMRGSGSEPGPLARQQRPVSTQGASAQGARARALAVGQQGQQVRKRRQQHRLQARLELLQQHAIMCGQDAACLISK